MTDRPQDVPFFRNDEWNGTFTPVSLLPYYPVYHFRYAHWETSYVLGLKNRLPNRANEVAELVKAELSPGLALAYVPSHDAERKDTGIRDVARILARTGLHEDVTECVVRHTTVPESKSGNRNPSLTLGSVCIKQPEKIAGKNVLLLDDIVTTGSSMWACTKLLMDAGANDVRCMAVGQTVGKEIEARPRSIQDLVKSNDRNRALIEKLEAKALEEEERELEAAKNWYQEWLAKQKEERLLRIENRIKEQLEKQKGQRPVDVVLFDLNYLVQLSTNMSKLLSQHKITEKDRHKHRIRIASAKLKVNVGETDLRAIEIPWSGVEFGIVTEYVEDFVQSLLTTLYSDVRWSHFLQTTANKISKKLIDLELPPDVRIAYFQSVLPRRKPVAETTVHNFIEQNDVLHKVGPNERKATKVGFRVMPVDAITKFMAVG